MDNWYVRPVPDGERRVCDGEIQVADGLSRCGEPAPYELLWIGTSGNTIALCRECLARLIREGEALLKGS